MLSHFFFFNDTATTEIYTLSLHDALPILGCLPHEGEIRHAAASRRVQDDAGNAGRAFVRSEEHTSELQSQSNLVCRLLLEKKKRKHKKTNGSKVQRSICRRHRYTICKHAY